MDDQDEAAWANSSPVSISRSASPATTVFPFGQLPCELRANIVVQASTYGETGNLLLVNKEFHSIVAPIHWMTLEINSDWIHQASVDVLVKTVLPRYRSLILQVSVCTTKLCKIEVDWDVIENVAELITTLPNLSSLSIHESLPRVISTSPFLDSLLDLNFDQGYTNEHAGDDGGWDVASLISRCPNLVAIDIVYPPSQPDFEDGRILVAALASRGALSSLVISNCDESFIDWAAEVVWKGPLTFLSLVHEQDGPPISLPHFSTFIAHFSTTLNTLSLTGPFDDFSDLGKASPPLPLPVLTDLILTYEPTSRDNRLSPSYQSDIFLPFINCPIKNATLDFRGTDHTADSIRTGLLSLMDHHRTTLQDLVVYGVSLVDGVFFTYPQVLDDSTVLELKTHAKELGVDMCIL